MFKFKDDTEARRMRLGILITKCRAKSAGSGDDDDAQHWEDVAERLACLRDTDPFFGGRSGGGTRPIPALPARPIPELPARPMPELPALYEAPGSYAVLGSYARQGRRAPLVVSDDHSESPTLNLRAIRRES